MTLSRRDFLNILSLIPFLTLIRESHSREGVLESPDKPGIIILLLDTLSAKHLPIYGYQRQTALNISRFAEKATVYHAHYSAGNYTTPGTASLLTGTYPWTHRAFIYASSVVKGLQHKNIFGIVGDKYYRVGYTQNPWVDLFLYQFQNFLDLHINHDRYNLTHHTLYNKIFSRDPAIAYRSCEEFLFEKEIEESASLIISLAYKLGIHNTLERLNKKHMESYPLGIPYVKNNAFDAFLVEDVFNGISALLHGVPKSSLVYIHLYPPHDPYRPGSDYLKKFDDGWQPRTKPANIFSEGISEDALNTLRVEYDQYISHVDAEFGRLYDYLLQSHLSSHLTVYNG